MEPPPTKKPRVPKVAKVKNKMPAEVQITAEQLLQEAAAQKVERVSAPPKQKVTSAAELADIQMRKRKEFEDNLRKNRTVISNWIKYAQWEESQQALTRARSVYERALDVNHRNVAVWLKYAEMEMKHKQINHARNIWDRAVTILPRANQFWFKYTYMEEMLGNIAGARQVGVPSSFEFEICASCSVVSAPDPNQFQPRLLPGSDPCLFGSGAETSCSVIIYYLVL